MSVPDSVPNQQNPFRQPAEPEPSTDTELFIRLSFAQNPAQGIELLFRRYYAPMHSQAARMVYSREVADDLVSEVFLNFWQKQVYQNVQTSYRAYLMASVRHAALAHLRREFANEQVALNWADELASATPQADQLMYYDELSQQIEIAIRNLPTQGQRVFLMSRTENKTNAEIAQLLQLSVRTVEVHLYRAMKTLKEVVDSKY